MLWGILVVAYNLLQVWLRTHQVLSDDDSLVLQVLGIYVHLVS